jgi:hypothetical protein
MTKHDSRRRAPRLVHPFVAVPLQGPAEVALVPRRWAETLPLTQRPATPTPTRDASTKP